LGGKEKRRTAIFQSTPKKWEYERRSDSGESVEGSGQAKLQKYSHESQKSKYKKKKGKKQGGGGRKEKEEIGKRRL